MDDEEESAEAEQEPVAEDEVVLQPQAAPEAAPSAPASSTPAPSGTVEVDERVFKAGCLFVDRGRVAVSMLQREFELDFKEATAILDKLQEAGLLGPYMGGQKRDILLTAEQWRERVQVAS